MKSKSTMALLLSAAMAGSLLAGCGSEKMMEQVGITLIKVKKLGKYIT